MIDVEPTPMPEGSAILENVPFLPDQDVPDRHNFGLIRLNKYLDDADNPDVQAILENPKRVIGRNVLTELGPGVIVNVTLTRAVEGQRRRISRVEVKLATDEDYDAHPSMIHLASGLTDDMARKFKPKSPWATKADKAQAEKIRKALERQQAREEKRLAREAAKKPVEEEAPADGVALYPVIYNGFLALEAESEVSLKKFGFAEYGDFAYIAIRDYRSFNAVLTFLEKKFYISRITDKRLRTMEASFKSRGLRKFDVTLAPISELKNFFQVSHKLSETDEDSGKLELKVYPVVLDDKLLLSVDIRTNPAVRKLIGKTIPNCTTKFDDASGFEIKFFNSKAELVRTVKDIRTSGIDITNYDELKSGVEDLSARIKNKR